jgi:hypothetical protein
MTSRHTVYSASSFLRAGWQVQFLEADAHTPLPRRFTFKEPEKIRDLARRGEAISTSEDRPMLEYAVNMGRGTSRIHLTPAQYARLRVPRET